MAKRKFITDVDSPKYLLALGQFIAQFAAVEALLTTVVWHFSKLENEPAIAKAVFQSMRVDAACKQITRLIDARHLRGKDIDELRLIITQLGVIGKTRNDIVHRGADGYGRLVVTNKPFAHIRSRIESQTVNPKILQSMEDDLLSIFIALTVIIKDCGDETPAQVRRQIGYFSPTSWLYKPRVRTLRPRKRRGQIQGRQPPPKASPK